MLIEEPRFLTGLVPSCGDASISESDTRALRATLSFVLDSLLPVVPETDYLDMVILVAAVQANVAHFAHAPSLNKAFATLDHSPPDTLRRPVPVNALAASINLSFETVRRRVGRLAQRNLCHVGPAGVVVTNQTMSQAGHGQILLDHQMRVHRLCRDAGLAAPASLEIPIPNPVDLGPVRAIARVSYDHLVRVLALLLAWLGDLTTSLSWAMLLRVNVEPLPHGFGAPDERAPVSVLGVARRLRLPEANVRRRLLQALDQGFCVRATGGLVVTDGVLKSPEFVNLMAANRVSLSRLSGQLERLGASPARPPL